MKTESENALDHIFLPRVEGAKIHCPLNSLVSAGLQS